MRPGTPEAEYLAVEKRNEKKGRWMMRATRTSTGGRLILAMSAGVLLGGLSVMAIPTLQLDIGGGTYVDGTTVAGANAFDVIALLNPDADSALSGVYRVSAALYPKTANSSPAPSVGTFSFAGTTYNVAADMAWGRPPDALLSGTTEIGSDLATHGIFDTYFMEFDVVFDANMQCVQYNVADTSDDPIAATDSGFFYQNFAVDVSGMDAGYGIHFDLYQVSASSSVANGSRVRAPQVSTTDIVEFAPFSHDAESSTSRTSVPDGASTVTLLGLALTGIAAMTRRMTG